MEIICPFAHTADQTAPQSGLWAEFPYANSSEVNIFRAKYCRTVHMLFPRQKQFVLKYLVVVNREQGK